MFLRNSDSVQNPRMEHQFNEIALDSWNSSAIRIHNIYKSTPKICFLKVKFDDMGIVKCFYLLWLLVSCSFSFLRMDQYFETRTWIVPKFAMVVPIGIMPFNSEKTATVNTILSGSGSRKMEEWLAVKNIIKVMLVSKDLLADWICASRFAKSTVTLLWSFPSELTVPF